MRRFFQDPGNLKGFLALTGLLLWVLIIPFLPRPGRPRGAETPLGFIGKLSRLSAAASDVVDTEKIEIDSDLTAVKVKITGQSFSADDLIDRTKGSTIVVLCHPEGLLVCQYGPYIFVVDNRDLIIHLATLESWKADGLYPCPQHSIAKPLSPARTPSGENPGEKIKNEAEKDQK